MSKCYSPDWFISLANMIFLLKKKKFKWMAYKNYLKHVASILCEIVGIINKCKELQEAKPTAVSYDPEPPGPWIGGKKKIFRFHKA